MATTSTNREDARDRNQTRVQLPVTSNLTVNEGDLVYWDGTNYTVTPLTASTQVSGNFLGMALQSNANQIYPGDADQVGVEILARGHVWMETTPAETYLPFDKVTVGATSQTIVKSGATTTNLVGYVVIDPPASPRAQQATAVPESITGAAGVRVRIALAPSHPYAAAL